MPASQGLVDRAEILGHKIIDPKHFTKASIPTLQPATAAGWWAFWLAEGRHMFGPWKTNQLGIIIPDWGVKPNENLQGLQLTSATRERNSHKQARQTRVPPILSSANLQLWYGNFGHPLKNMARREQWWAYQGKKDSALGIKHGHVARSAGLLWLMKSIILDLLLQIITLAGFWLLDF